MAKQYKHIDPLKYYRDYLSHGIRPDGREIDEFRPVIINTDSITTTNGSAIVKIGNTTVVCGIKAELTTPKAETPNKGFFIPNIELPPLCSPIFRPGPPSDQAQVTSCLIARIIENAECISLQDLCIAPDRLAWVLYCDLICLNFDGSLTDACILAIVSALKTVKLPEVIYDATLDTKTVNDTVWKPLNVRTLPVSATYAIFDDMLITDPTNEEENLCTGIVTIVVDDTKVCFVHKPGGSPLSSEQIKDCIDKTNIHSQQVTKLINTALCKANKK